MRIAISVASVLLGILITGCASTHEPYVYSTPNGQVITSGPYQNPADTALDTAVRAEMNRYGDLAAVSPNVHVTSQSGVVTLTGAVRSERDREMIDALVRNTSGVTAVNDQLQVMYPPTSGYGQAPRVYSSPPPPVTPPPVVASPDTSVVPGPAAFPQVQATSATDQALANRIVDRLHWDSVPSSWLQNATITVTNGDVYLQGYVDNSREHQGILDALEHTTGIRNIYDQLQVR